jgi:outer membrane murein-binding lipoprotein Lpp
MLLYIEDCFLFNLYKEEKMKKIIISIMLVTGVVSLSAKKDKTAPEMPDINAQMEKADKIENYRAKKDVAWHKIEYNKVLKYLNKTKK